MAMAMAASSSTAAHYPYDVFISHRGPDVKKTFASHLYRGLSKNGLRAFLDQPELQQGDSLTAQILYAVRTASIHVAVFSPRYAESSWCLNELLLMLDSGKTIIPVFHHVTPAELRWTRGNDGKYAEALQRLAKKRTYEGKCRYESNTIENWRSALSSVADISGFELEACNGDEGELVDNVVRCVLKKVKRIVPKLNVAKYPTGLDEKVKDFKNKVLLQQQQSEKPPVLGIVGLGGVGKTTLAKELFNLKSSHYSSSCFLSDVRESVRQGNLISLQRKLLKDLTGSDLQIGSIDENIETLKKHMSSSQIFVILDDVDKVDQVDSLLPDLSLIRSDSLILITSRNKDIITSSGVEDSSIYKLNGLNQKHSQELFCSHAFLQPYPLAEFEPFVDKFLKACQGLPLSLKVFGALLCGKKTPSYWEDQLDKLQRILPSEIKQRLQISFEALDVEEQNIFLDVACFFMGEDRDMAVRIWDGSHWKGFQNLEDRCLVEVDSSNTIRMHDHLRDLGRDIAKATGLVRGTENVDDLLQQLSSLIKEVRGISTGLEYDSDDNEPHDHLRDLGRDIAKAPGLVRGTENVDDLLQQLSSVITDVRGIRTVPSYDFYDNEPTKARSEMSLHRGILQVPQSKAGLLEPILTRVQLPNLIWLRWYDCPHSYLPSWIPLKNLRVLQLESYGNEWISLWEDLRQAPLQLRDLTIEGVLENIPNFIGQLKYLERISVNFDSLGLPEEFCRLQSLKTLELIECTKMKSLPDSFGNLSNLESIDLTGCCNLERLPISFGNLTKLKFLNLKHCSELTMSSETLGNISSLESINLDGCAKIEVLPLQLVHQRSLEKLRLEGTNIKELPNAVGELSYLEVLSVGSPSLDTLPPSLGALKNLKTLRLQHCQNLKRLPDSVAQLTQLTELHVSGCPISELPSLSDLGNLKTLILEGLTEFVTKSIKGLAQLTELSRLNVCELSELEDLEGVEHLRSLTYLSTFRCVKLKSIRGLAQLTMLGRLNVSECSELEDLEGVEHLRSLTDLWASKCVKLKSIKGLAQLTQLSGLDVSECSELEDLEGVEHLRSLRYLKASKCVKLKSIKGLAQLTKLRELRVGGCSELEDLEGVEHLRSLNSLWASECVKLKSIKGLAQLTQLFHLNVSECSELENLEGIEHCRCLMKLYASGCPKLRHRWGQGNSETAARTIE